ncbi:MAG TPA: hypothetical protein VFB38_22625 [Chthonomonadaceae bacterium]|nr:hypothetical protein [Chthonomonadaceae bacterium]
MKQKINPMVAGIIILGFLAVVGAVMYFQSEPPMVNVPKKSEAEMIKEGKAGMEGFKAALGVGKPKPGIAGKEAPKKGNAPHPDSGTDKKNAPVDAQAPPKAEASRP